MVGAPQCLRVQVNVGDVVMAVYIEVIQSVWSWFVRDIKDLFVVSASR